MPQVIDKIRILFGWWHDQFDFWRKEILHRDLDSYWCCNGRECGCGGGTIREMFLPKEASDGE